MEAKNYIITEKQVGIRIDKVLSELNSDLSRVTVQRLIDESKVLVNGKKTKASYKVALNDKIEIFEDIPKTPALEAENIPLSIIYEDNDILVVDKQKGLVVHPGNR